MGEMWTPLMVRRNGEHFYAKDYEKSTWFYTIKNKEEFAEYDKEKKILYLRTDFPKDRKNQLRREIQKSGRYEINDISEYMNMVGGI